MRPWVAVTLAGLAFGGGLLAGSLTTGSTVTVTTTAFEAINNPREASRGLAPLPTLIAGAIDPRRIPLWTAVPVDANLDSAAFVVQPPEQLVVTWDRAERQGIAVWQLDSIETARWHRVYTREETRSNVLEYDAALGDVTGDGRPEILVFESTGGSAGNGSYHLLMSTGARLREVFAKRLSWDEGRILLGRGALIVREGVDFVGTIHCCYRNVRETWLRWNGRRLFTLCTDVHRNREPMFSRPPSRTCRADA
jgi:hypothetical protein